MKNEETPTPKCNAEMDANSSFTLQELLPVEKSRKMKTREKKIGDKVDINLQENAESLLCKKDDYSCGNCNTSFTSLRLLKKHICHSVVPDGSSDGGDENEASQEVGSTSNDSTLDHEIAGTQESKLSKHGEKMYQCTACPKQYAMQHYLTRHFAACHNGLMPYRCHNCTEEFASSVKFKEHCKQHGVTKPFKCDKCQLFFTSVEVLRVHDRTHTGERPFSCETCGKHFKQSSNLQDHIRKHKNDRSFICGTCGKSFNLKGDLTKHLLLHTGERKFRCQLCPKAFPNVSNLNRHIRTHTGIRPYTCSFCQKSFPRKERLKEHERIHTGERPFSCPICSKSFADSGNFSKHKKGHCHAEKKTCRRFLNTTETARPVQTGFEDQSVDSITNDDDLGKQGATPLLSQKIVLAVPSQLVCYLGNQGMEPLCVMKNEVESNHNIVESEINQPLLQEQLQTLYNKQNEAIATGLSPHKKEEICCQSTADGTPDRYLSVTGTVTVTSGLGSAKLTGKPSEAEATATNDNNSLSFDLVRPSDGLPFSDSFSLPESSSSVMITPSKFLPALRPLYEDYVQRAESTDKVISAKVKRNLEEADPNETEVDNKSLLSSSASSIITDVPEHYYASNLTLIDLTKADDTQSYNYQSGYVMLQDSDGEARKLGEILFATPTKSYPEECSQSPSSLICSQILVTPEHASLPRQAIDRGKVKPRVLEL